MITEVNSLSQKNKMKAKRVGVGWGGGQQNGLVGKGTCHLQVWQRELFIPGHMAEGKNQHANCPPRSYVCVRTQTVKPFYLDKMLGGGMVIPETQASEKQLPANAVPVFPEDICRSAAQNLELGSDQRPGHGSLFARLLGKSK